MTKTTKWYHYDQNNSGGSFGRPAYNVYIEAFDCRHADFIAEDNDLYFDGVDKGRDCECCGDRWYKAWEEDGIEGSKEKIKTDKDQRWDWNRRWNKGKKDPIPVALFISLDGKKEEVF